MIGEIVLYAAGVLMLLGAGFSLLATVGLLRLPDLYTRLHAASKAGLVGAGLVLLAVIVSAGEPAVTVRALLGTIFLALTTPISAHLLAKAAYFSGLKPADITRTDELRDPK